MASPSYDIVVIGAGPAGLTAATEAARSGLKAFCLDKLAPGGELVNLGELHEFEEIFSGTDMAARLTDDAVVAGGEVASLSGNGPCVVTTTDGESYQGRAVVVATGLHKGKLGIAGEENYEGRGLSHCATCDGPLYAGQSVIVAGATGWGPYEAAALVGIASDVTLLGDPEGPVAEGIDVKPGRIVGLAGDGGLQSVTIEAGGARNDIPTNAVFIYVGRSPAAEFLPDSLARDDTGHIVVDEQGRTSTPLVFAVGDVRTRARHYIADAIADGQKVAKEIVAALKQ